MTWGAFQVPHYLQESRLRFIRLSHIDPIEISKGIILEVKLRGVRKKSGRVLRLRPSCERLVGWKELVFRAKHFKPSG